MEENTRSTAFCLNTTNPFLCRSSLGGQVIGGLCDNTKPPGYGGTQGEWEAESILFESS